MIPQNTSPTVIQKAVVCHHLTDTYSITCWEKHNIGLCLFQHPTRNRGQPFAMVGIQSIAHQKKHLHQSRCFFRYMGERIKTASAVAQSQRTSLCMYAGFNGLQLSAFSHRISDAKRYIQLLKVKFANP